MPALNVEKYIRPCMESVLGQTEKDLEILVIDAGSTDGTWEILAEYAEQDKRVQVISSERKSYGYQINKGIAMAKGEYVGIVETDVKIEPDMMARLYQEAEKTGADYVKGTAYSFLELPAGQCLQVPIGMAPEEGKERCELCPRETPDLFVKDVYLWTGIYRREFIKKIKLQETAGAAYQDAGFMFQAYCTAEKAVYLKQGFYWYRQDNLSASSYDKRGFHYFVQEYNYIEQYFDGLGEEWKRVFYRRMLDHCRRRFQVMAASGYYWSEAEEDMNILRSRLGRAVEEGALSAEGLEEESREKLLLFLKSPYDIYQRYKEEYQRRVEHVKQMLKVIGEKKVVLFGCGAWGRFLHTLLEYRKPGCVAAYCDNQRQLWNTKVQGISVWQPEQARATYPDAVYIITSQKFKKEIEEQLYRLEIPKERLYFYTAGMDMLLFQR